jgi:aminoglycoside 2'-N-acetyltransferase I
VEADLPAAGAPDPDAGPPRRSGRSQAIGGERDAGCELGDGEVEQLHGIRGGLPVQGHQDLGRGPGPPARAELGEVVGDQRGQPSVDPGRIRGRQRRLETEQGCSEVSMTTPAPPPVSIRRATSSELSATDLAQLLDLFGACWPGGGFASDDVDHAMGGVHWIAEVRGRIVAHSSVVPRMLEAGGIPLATGYVEAVATHPAWQRRGIASRLMTAADAHIAKAYALGALSTSVPAVYERLGWERWRGPTFVRTPDGPVRTADEDDGIMVLRTPRTPPVRGDEPLSCEWRPGDVW